MFSGWDLDSFLDGLLAADGCRYKGRTIFTSISEVLVEQVRLLAITQGHLPTISDFKSSHGYANRKQAWEVRWTDSPKRREVKQHAGMCLLPVRSVLFEPYTGPVYNFEVDDSHSYLVNGIAVHNCMLFAGCRSDRPGLLCINSWGEDWIRGPKVMEQPEGSFWVDAEVCDKMLQNGDSFAISNFAGYPDRSDKLDYLLF